MNRLSYYFKEAKFWSFYFFHVWRQSLSGHMYDSKKKFRHLFKTLIYQITSMLNSNALWSKSIV